MTTALRILVAVFLVLSIATLVEVMGAFHRQKRPTLEQARELVFYEVVFAIAVALAIGAAALP